MLLDRSDLKYKEMAYLASTGEGEMVGCLDPFGLTALEGQGHPTQKALDSSRT